MEELDQFVMINWTQVREGINQVSTQLATGTVTSADILKNVMPYILAVADLGIKMENEHANLGARVLLHQGAIDVRTNRPAKSHTGSTRGILENLSVTDLPVLGTDKHSVRNWNDRLVSAVSNIRPGSRKILNAMMEYVDQEIGGNFEAAFKQTQECQDMEAAGTTYGSIDEDLYTLLTDRTEGEAALRVRGSRQAADVKPT